MLTPIQSATVLTSEEAGADAIWLKPPIATDAMAAPFRYVASSFTRSFGTRFIVA